MSTAEGERYAARMDSLFVEASAKTALGVREVFTELVEKILDTPELWAAPSAVGAAASPSRKPANATAAGGNMPGDINLGETRPEETGCSC